MHGHALPAAPTLCGSRRPRPSSSVRTMPESMCLSICVVAAWQAGVVTDWIASMRRAHGGLTLTEALLTTGTPTMNEQVR